MSERPHHSERPNPLRATGGNQAAETPAAGLAAMIRDAESLHQALGEARSQARRLIVALRRHRKQERLVNATLASLRQLKLQEAAE